MRLPEVKAPREASQRVSFLSILENLDVEPGEEAAKLLSTAAPLGTIVGEKCESSASGSDPWQFGRNHLQLERCEPAESIRGGANCRGASIRNDVSQEPAGDKFGAATTLNEGGSH